MKVDKSYSKFDTTKIYMMISIISYKTERKISKLSIRNKFLSLVLEKRLKYITSLSLVMIYKIGVIGNGSYLTEIIRK